MITITNNSKSGSPSGRKKIDYCLNIRFPIFVCVALRAAFFEKSRFSFFVCVALRAASILEFTISHFVCVALRAASILKNRVFFIHVIFVHIAKLANFRGFEPREYPRTLSFEKWCRMH